MRYEMREIRDEVERKNKRQETHSIPSENREKDSAY